jgi:ABC-2 type transport system ATP-binding protein
MSDKTAIELKNVTKSFEVKKDQENQNFIRRLFVTQKEKIMAVDALNLKISKGEMFGLLGPNGAGKTTTIRMISGLIEPTNGEIFVDGLNALADPQLIQNKLGVVLAGDRVLYWKLTGRENLEFFGALYRIPPKKVKQRTNELLEMVGLADRANDKVEQYSTGMKRRLAFVKGLINDPPIILLDEPTAGLDPQAAVNLRELVISLKNNLGKTILLTTHNMQEADQLCDRVGIIDHGKIIALDTPQNLKSQSGSEILVLHLNDELSPEAAATLREIPLVKNIVYTGMEHSQATSEENEKLLKISTQNAYRVVPEITRLLHQMNVDFVSIEVQQPTLESVFIQLTGKELREE